MGMRREVLLIEDGQLINLERIFKSENTIFQLPMHLIQVRPESK
jgi:hypothetical protein